MQLESRAPGYWLVHNVVPPIGLQIPLAPSHQYLCSIKLSLRGCIYLVIPQYASMSREMTSYSYALQSVDKEENFIISSKPRDLKDQREIMIYILLVEQCLNN
jgi:hypothetical protein